MWECRADKRSHKQNPLDTGLLCPLRQFPHDGGKAFVFADAVVPGRLHPVEHVPALIMLRQLVKILSGFRVDQLVRKDGGKALSVILLIRAVIGKRVRAHLFQRVEGFLRFPLRDQIGRKEPPVKDSRE